MRDRCPGCAIQSSIAKHPAMPRISVDDDRLDVAEAAVLHDRARAARRRRQAHAPQQRDAEQQLQRDGRAEHLGQVARGDRDFAEDPQDDRRPARVRIAARLREIAAAGDAQPRGERLQQDRHQVRQHDDAEQRVAEPRAAGDVGRPVARDPCSRRRRGSPARRRPASSSRSRRRREWRSCREPPAGSPVSGSQLGSDSVDGRPVPSMIVVINSIMISRVASTASPPHRPAAHRQLRRLGQCPSSFGRSPASSIWAGVTLFGRLGNIESSRAGRRAGVRRQEPGSGTAGLGRHRPGRRPRRAAAIAVYRVAADGGAGPQRRSGARRGGLRGRWPPSWRPWASRSTTRRCSTSTPIRRIR